MKECLKLYKKYSKVVGVIDRNEDEELIVVVDGEEVLFKDIVESFLGGEIQMNKVEE